MTRLLILASLCFPTVLSAEPIQIRKGDRVVFVGNTVIERAQRFGHLETFLHLGAGEGATSVTFRNVGWSGDSVFGDARSYFGPPKEGRDRLQRILGELKPTILIACYGTNAAMTSRRGWTDDPAGKERSRAGDEAGRKLFIEGYGKLLDLMKGAAGEGLREVVLLSPPPLENLGAPLPDQTANNKRLAIYRNAIRALARERGYRFVDLFAAMGGDQFDGSKAAATPLTTNGLHYADAGYQFMAAELVRGLGLKIPENLSANDPEVVQMRATVVKKNRLFFHRWRPVNETYLFLFRKHEQGRNAREIPMFDPLIEVEEKQIEEQRSRVLKKLAKK